MFVEHTGTYVDIHQISLEPLSQMECPVAFPTLSFHAKSAIRMHSFDTIAQGVTDQSND